MVRRAYRDLCNGGGHDDVTVTSPALVWSPPYLRRTRPSDYIIKRSVSELKRDGIKQEGRAVIPNPARLLELLMSWPELAKECIFELDKQKKQEASKKEAAKKKKEKAKQKKEKATQKKQAYINKRRHLIKTL